MSRTYRKPRPWQIDQLYWEYEIVQGGYWIVKVPKTPTKKELAEIKRDGYVKDKHTGWYMNQISRTRRANDRQELQKVYRLENYEDYDFDDSHAERFRKGIWWLIY